MTSYYTRYYTVPYRGEKEEVIEFDDILVRQGNASGQSREQVLLENLKEGTYAREKRMAENGAYNTMQTAIARHIVKQHEERRIMNELSILLEHMGRERFVAWCETTTEVDQEMIKLFLTNYTWRNEDLRWNARARDWLLEYLSDGEPRPTVDIHRDAVAAGIIEEGEEGWRRLRVLASRMGLTKSGVYGSWCLSRVENG